MKMVDAREREISNHRGESKSYIWANDEYSFDDKIVKSKIPNSEFYIRKYLLILRLCNMINEHGTLVCLTIIESNEGNNSKETGWKTTVNQQLHKSKYSAIKVP
jgi:hypothetical protein